MCRPCLKIEMTAMVFSLMCVSVQVYSSQQVARAWVYAFPTMHRAYRMMDSLANLHCEPPTQQLMNDTAVSDAQNALNWEIAVAYSRTVTAESVHHHVPSATSFVLQSTQRLGVEGSAAVSVPSADLLGLRPDMF